MSLSESRPPDPPVVPPRRLVAPVAHATRNQRIALLAGILVVAYIALKLFASVLMPFVAAAGMAYFLDPAATRLQRAGVPRGLASVLLILAMLLASLLFLLLLYPLIISQLSLLIARVPAYVGSAQGFARQMISQAQERLGADFVDEKLRDLIGGQAGAIVSFATSSVSSFVLSLIGSGVAIFNVLTLAVVTPIVAFYLLRDWPEVTERIDSWMPRRYHDVLILQAREVNRILSAWVRGQALCCVILGLYYAIALTAVGLDLGLIVGLASGMLSFIPYVGTITAFVTAMGLAFAQFDHWSRILLVLGVLIVGQTLEGYVIYPRFLGDRVELGSVWVIFALFAGGAAFGFVGVMLAVPVAATIGVLCRFWLRRYLDSPLYLDPGDEAA